MAQQGLKGNSLQGIGVLKRSILYNQNSAPPRELAHCLGYRILAVDSVET